MKGEHFLNHLLKSVLGISSWTQNNVWDKQLTKSVVKDIGLRRVTGGDCVGEGVSIYLGFISWTQKSRLIILGHVYNAVVFACNNINNSRVGRSYFG